MPLPKTTSTDVFYKRQLWVHNFGITSAKNPRTHCFMYPESVAKKTSNEPISFLKFYIENIMDPTIRILYVFSDNCVAQNKNHALLQFYYTLIKSGRFDKIIIRFPEPGHSFMPCDRAFGIIEKNLRKADRVYVPEYYKIVKNTSSSFSVVPVNKEMVFNMVEHLNRFFSKAPTICNEGSRPKKFLITRPRIFIFDSELISTTGTLLVSAGEGSPFERVQMYATELVSLTGAKNAYIGALPIKPLKYRDVISLAKNYVPLNDSLFYNDLVCGGNNGDQ